MEKAPSQLILQLWHVKHTLSQFTSSRVICQRGRESISECSISQTRHTQKQTEKMFINHTRVAAFYDFFVGPLVNSEIAFTSALGKRDLTHAAQ
jgi:hypothetical protein